MIRWQAWILAGVLGAAAHSSAAQDMDTGQYAEVPLSGVVDVSQLPVPQPSREGQVDSGPVSDPPPTGTQPDVQPDPNVVYLEGPGWIAWVQKDILSATTPVP